MPNHNSLVPESYRVPYLRHMVNPSSEAGREEDSYQPGRYGNVLGEVESRTMELLSRCHLLRSIARHALQRESNRHIEGNFANVASSERYLSL
jgi:hypothetical protein